MRTRFFAAAALLGVLAVSSAKADSMLDFTLSAPVFDPVSNTYLFSGTLKNNTNDTFFFGDLNLTATNGADVFNNFFDFGPAGELELGPGSSYTNSELFEVGRGSVVGDIVGTAVFTADTDPNGNGREVTPVLTFSIPGAGVVPEPGTVALFTGMMVSGGLMMARRRRK